MASNHRSEAAALAGGRYRVLERLGSGGMATVLLAEDNVLRRSVAVKRLRPGSSGDEERRILREARLGASLSHPGLATIYDVVADGEEGTLIVMEHVEGRSLSEAIPAGGLEPERVVELLRPVASALDFAHRHGVVHRDVKPSNVLIGGDGSVKLVDLGAAIAPDSTQITTENRIVGTVAYIAPERLAGEDPGGPAADVYSLAMTAFEALTGTVPLAGRSPAEVWAETAGGPPPDLRDHWPDAPAPLANALSRGLDRNPGRRQATATQLVADLELGLADSAEPPPALVPAATAEWSPAGAAAGAAGGVDARPTPSSRIPWLAAAALALVAVATVAAILGAGGGTPERIGGQASRASSGAPPRSGSSSHAGAGAHRASPGGGGAAGSGASTAPTTTPTASASGAATGAQLNDRGYALLQSGDPGAAVPVLRRAVAAFPPGTTDVNYAYALFNLGHALRLAGDPQAAIPILEQRLRIPDQTPVVQHELDLARAAVGSGGVRPLPPPGHSKPPTQGKPPKPEPPGHIKHGDSGGEGVD